jgi:hypothetical protein
MYNRKDRKYRIKANHHDRTYTIRVYENGKVIAKYRTNVQGKGCMTDDWTEDDIRNYLNHYPGDYYEVK